MPRIRPTETEFDAIGTRVFSEKSTSQTVGGGSTNLVSVSLTAGIWVLVGSAVYQALNTNPRGICITATSNGMDMDACQITPAGTSTQGRPRLNVSKIVKITQTTTYYLTNWSGVAQTLDYSRLDAVRII